VVLVGQKKTVGMAVRGGQMKRRWTKLTSGWRAIKAEAQKCNVFRCRGDQMLGWNWFTQVAVRLAMDHRSMRCPPPSRKWRSF
jgi:hypothetical protein